MKPLIWLGLFCALCLIGDINLAVEPGLTFYYEEDAQCEFISPQGTRVLIDVNKYSRLSRPVDSNDILLTTHGHDDHYDPIFYEAFPGKKLWGAGELQVADVKITGIGAAHGPVDQLTVETSNNTIYLIEIAGFRIAHFGDIGQDFLTSEQLKSLGEVDIAVTQFANPFSLMNVWNKKGFNLMDQVKPKLIIPTHIDIETSKYAAQKWSSFYYNSNKTILAKNKLDSKTKFVFMGMYAESFGKICEIPKADFLEN